MHVSVSIVGEGGWKEGIRGKFYVLDYMNEEIKLCILCYNLKDSVM